MEGNDTWEKRLDEALHGCAMGTRSGSPASEKNLLEEEEKERWKDRILDAMEEARAIDSFRPVWKVATQFDRENTASHVGSANKIYNDEEEPDCCAELEKWLLAWAIQIVNAPLVYALVDHEWFVAEWIHSDICRAAELGDWDIFRCVYESNPTKVSARTLQAAARNGHCRVVSELLKNAAVDPGEEASRAIRLAATGGHTAVVRKLLEDGRSDPSDHHNAAICYSAEKGFEEVVELLLSDDRVDPSDSDNYALRSAARYGHVGVIKLLLADHRLKPYKSKKPRFWLAKAYPDLYLSIWDAEEYVVTLREDPKFEKACDLAVMQGLVMSWRCKPSRKKLVDTRANGNTD